VGLKGKKDKIVILGHFSCWRQQFSRAGHGELHVSHFQGVALKMSRQNWRGSKEEGAFQMWTKTKASVFQLLSWSWVLCMLGSGQDHPGHHLGHGWGMVSWVGPERHLGAWLEPAPRSVWSVHSAGTVLLRIFQKNRTHRMCVAKTVYFKELTHMSVEALCIQNLTGGGRHVRDSGRSCSPNVVFWELRWESWLRVVCWRISSCQRKGTFCSMEDFS
jgi:hypothetical protein